MMWFVRIMERRTALSLGGNLRGNYDIQHILMKLRYMVMCCAIDRACMLITMGNYITDAGRIFIK